jgi:hypothetical protein
VCGQHHAAAAFTPGKDPVPVVQEAGWAPEPVWIGAENLAPPGFDPRSFQPVASRYTDYAIPSPISETYTSIYKPARRHIAEDLNQGLQPAASGSNAANIFVHCIKGKFHSITCHKGRNRKQRYTSTLSLTSGLNVLICLDIYVYTIIVFISCAAR